MWFRVGYRGLLVISSFSCHVSEVVELQQAQLQKQQAEIAAFLSLQAAVGLDMLYKV